MQTLTVNNVEIQVERKPIKNLHLSVYPPDGRVHVSAPLLYSDERIQLYINKKWAWITAKRAALTSFNIQSPREYVSGEAHYFMGQLYRLKVERDGRFPQHVEIVGDYITVTVRPQAEPQHIEGVLYAWYKEQLTPVISGMVEKYSEKLGIAASVTALAERYERTLGEMETSASDLEKRVNNHLSKMGFEV